MDRKDILLNKQRIVIKVGTSTITYEETGNINLAKLEKTVDQLERSPKIILPLPQLQLDGPIRHLIETK